MHLVGKVKVLQTVARKKEKPLKPVSVNFEVNSTCNLHCVMCARWDYRKGKVHWSLDQFKKLFDQLRPEFTAIHGYSEPLLNRDLTKLIRYASDQGSNVSITSNLLPLKNEEQAKELIESGLELLKISIDGNTNEGYGKVRGVEKIEKVKENIRLVEQTKKKLGAKRPGVRLSYTITHFNHQEIIPFLKYVKEETDQSVIYFQMLLFSKTLLKDKDWPSVSKETFLNTIMDAQEFAEENGIRTNFDRVLKYFPIYWSAYHEGEKTMTNRICLKPYLTTFVASNGDVKPCDLLGLDGPTMGNVFEQSFEEIWHSQKYVDFRRQIKSGGHPTEECASCFPDSFSDLRYYSKFSNLG